MGGKIPRRRKWHPTPAFLSGKLHGQRNPGSYSHGVAKNQTWLSTHTLTHTFTHTATHLEEAQRVRRLLSSTEQGWARRSSSHVWLASSLDGPAAPAGSLSLSTTKRHAPRQPRGLRGPWLFSNHSAFSPRSQDAPAEQLGEVLLLGRKHHAFCFPPGLGTMSSGVSIGDVGWAGAIRKSAFACRTGQDGGSPCRSGSTCDRRREPERQGAACSSSAFTLTAVFPFDTYCLGLWRPGSRYNSCLMMLAAPSGTFQIWFPTHHPAGDTHVCVPEPVNREAEKVLFLAFKV